MTDDSASHATKVTVFDLDGTLTWRDTLLPYLTGFLGTHPGRLPRLWDLPFALGVYAFGARDRGELKSRVIRAAMSGMSRASIDAWSDRFVAGLHPRRAFRPGAIAVLETHRSARDTLILLSASPDLYVPRVGALLGFDRTICTEVSWRGDRLDGQLLTANRRGEEKLRCLEALRREYPGAIVTAYGNSASDLPHLERADHPVLVNGSTAARRGAVRAGIPVADWT